MIPPEGDERPPAHEPIELVVRYERMNTFFADYIENISRGRTFVATLEPLAADTELDFVLEVPALELPLALHARVLWTRAPEVASREQPAGMGIAFRYADAIEQAQTEAVIEALLIDHLGARHALGLLGRPGREPQGS